MLQSILGQESKILSSDKEVFLFAMRIDEMEEFLEQDDTYSLFWVNQHIKKKGRAEFLKGLDTSMPPCSYFGKVEAISVYSN